MTSADLDHNDKLLAAGKKEKLEWVTPKISLMLSQDTLGSQKYPKASDLAQKVLPDQLYLKPRHTYKNSHRKGSVKTLF
jgi:hypothetical protein